MFLVIKDPSVGHICFVFMIKAKKKKTNSPKKVPMCAFPCVVHGPRFSHCSHITVQTLDWPVSRETSSLFLSRTRMASFPYCEYHMLRLLLR